MTWTKGEREDFTTKAQRTQRRGRKKELTTEGTAFIPEVETI